MKNISDKETQYCLWDRTLCKGGGFAFFPLNKKSRFPQGWAAREKGRFDKFNTETPSLSNVKILDGVLIVEAKGESGKLGADSRAVLPGELDFARLTAQFPDQPGTRAVIHVQVERISTSCGHGVPLMDFRADRDLIAKWSESKGADGLAEYRRIKNVKSIDGLPAL